MVEGEVRGGRRRGVKGREKGRAKMCLVSLGRRRRAGGNGGILCFILVRNREQVYGENK